MPAAHFRLSGDICYRLQFRFNPLKPYVGLRVVGLPGLFKFAPDYVEDPELHAVLLCEDQQLSPDEFSRECRKFATEYCHKGTRKGGQKKFKNETFAWPDPPLTMNIQSQAGRFVSACLACRGDRQFYNQPPGRFVAYALRQLDVPCVQNVENLALLGHKIDVPSVLPGDLLFFSLKGEQVPDFVGVSLGGMEMLCADAENGNIVDAATLDDSWTLRFVQARRVFGQ